MYVLTQLTTGITTNIRPDTDVRNFWSASMMSDMLCRGPGFFYKFKNKQLES